MKTDNHNLGAKVALRLHFLEKYHPEGAEVLDCCQATGAIWRELRKRVAVRSYWGVDLVPRHGRLRADSVRILAQPGWRQDVIDCDVYGSPWAHWFAMLPNVVRPTTVFLTVAQIRIGAPALLLSALGVRFKRLRMPPSLGGQLIERGVVACLAAAREHGLELPEVAECPNPGGMARYIGVRLIPSAAAPL